MIYFTFGWSLAYQRSPFLAVWVGVFFPTYNIAFQAFYAPVTVLFRSRNSKAHAFSGSKIAHPLIKNVKYILAAE